MARELDDYTKGRLTLGLPLVMQNGIKVYPPTIEDILGMGELEYGLTVNTIAMTISDVEEMRGVVITEEERKDLKPFIFIAEACYFSIEYREQFCKHIEMFVKDKVEFIEDMKCFCVGEMINRQYIDADNYHVFNLYVQYVCDIEKKEKPPKKDESKMTKLEKKKARLAKQRQEGREKASKAKGKDTSLSELVVNMATFTDDINYVKALTIYQFNALYQKYMRKEGYQNSFDLFLVSGDNKELDNHWTDKYIEKVEEAPQSIT